MDGGISRRKALAILGGVSAHLYGLAAWAGDCGAPPPAERQSWKGGESFPPLPLPVTPLRRSEKKRPPAPPALIGKLQYGKQVAAVGKDGRRYTYRDWTTDPGDIKSLMNHANRQLGIRYRPLEIDFQNFSWSPRELPVLYLTGHEGFAWTPELRAAIRRYLLDGGTLLGDACCGSEDYRRAFLTEIAQIFPQRSLKILPQEHPVYTAFHTIAQVGYLDDAKGAFDGPPILEGITVGCREAVFLSQYDLSCAWDGHKHAAGKRVWPAKGALSLGINMVAHALATYRLGQYLATTTVYEETAPARGGGLVLGQIQHGGDWNPNPSGLMTLMKYARRKSTMDLRFRTAEVNLAGGGDLAYPILYMTGHAPFTLSAGEIARLRTYLHSGGVLFADACCGRQAFDTSFRRMLAKVLPGADLTPITAEHPLLRMVGDSRTIGVTPALAAKRQGAGLPPLKAPLLEGIAMGGGLGVIYSPIGIGCGWEDEACPYCLGYDQPSARGLGLNILAFAMSH